MVTEEEEEHIQTAAAAAASDVFDLEDLSANDVSHTHRQEC